MTVRRHVWVSGGVQAVGFRVSCARRADAAGVGGWVRNLPDGRVEAVFEGEEAAVAGLIDWCRSGPRLAQVEHVEVVAEAPHGDRAFRAR